MPQPGAPRLSEKDRQVLALFLQRWLERKGHHDDLVLVVPPAVRAAADDRAGAATAGPLSFVVASCQFPYGLFDREPAGRVWRHLVDRLREGDGDAPLPDEDGELPVTLEPDRKRQRHPFPPVPRPGFALQLGDQVYVDAVGNVFEAPTLDPNNDFTRAYELNWRLRSLRRAAARLPVLALPDDHEVADDWQPEQGPPAGGSRAALGLQAWHGHQGKLNPPRLSTQPDASLSFAFAPGGVPFFVLDTRTRREPRRAGTLAAARIAPQADFDALFAWLLRHRDAPVKFIASQAPLLPPPRLHGSLASRLAWDGWDGYPASSAALLRFVRDARIRGVVLLGGDAHRSAVVRLHLGAAQPAVHGIVSSGSYAPWPFSDTRADDWCADGPWSVGEGAGAVGGRLERLVELPSSAIALVSTAPVGQRCEVRVELCPAEGGAPTVASFMV